MFYARLRFINKRRWDDSDYEPIEIISPRFKTQRERNLWINQMIQNNLSKEITVRKYLYPPKNAKEEQKNYEYDLERIMMG